MAIVVLLLVIACSLSASVIAASSYYWWSNLCGIASDNISDCTSVKLNTLTDDNGVRINLQYKGVEIKAAKNKKIRLVLEGTLDPMEEFTITPESTVITKNQNKFQLQKEMGNTLKTDATVEFILRFENEVDMKTTKVFYKEV